MRRRAVVLVLVGLSLSSMCLGQQDAPTQPVNGYPMLDASRIYGPGEKVQVGEPHGVYTGSILIDEYYFVRPLRVNEVEQAKSGVKGTLSASVRRATSPSWLAMDFDYGCDDRDLKLGQIELARTSEGEFIIGDHNAVCDLRPVKVPQEQTGQPPRISLQDVIAGRISCNDPRVLDAPLDPSAREKSPGVSSRDYLFIACVVLRLTRGNRMPLPPGLKTSWSINAAHNTAINSITAQLNSGQLAVFAYDSMAAFVNYDPDEEAFIISHEIGHVHDWSNCQALRAQALRQLPFARQHALAMAQQKCEEAADFYGLQYMWGAGFNPLAAGALLGRLEMYAPNQTTGVGSMLTNFIADHPIGSERVKKLRAGVTQLCSKPGTVCQER